MDGIARIAGDSAVERDLAYEQQLIGLHAPYDFRIFGTYQKHRKGQALENGSLDGHHKLDASSSVEQPRHLTKGLKYLCLDLSYNLFQQKLEKKSHLKNQYLVDELIVRF